MAGGQLPAGNGARDGLARRAWRRVSGRSPGDFQSIVIKYEQLLCSN